MGKKGYNWKARRVPEVEIDDSSTKKISLDIEHRNESYDNCNALVLPNEKRKTKNKDKKVTVTRLLSKKRRKQLEKVVERKEKKLQRATLLEELAKVQVPADELKQYVSLTAVQTKGLKRHFRETEAYKTNLDIVKDDDGEIVVNAIKGSKKQRLALLYSDKKKDASVDPNIVGLNESSESDDSESSEDIEDIDSKSNDSSNKDANINEDGVNKTDKEKSPEIVQIGKTNNNKNDNGQSCEIIREPPKVTKAPEKSVILIQDRKPAVFVPLNRKSEIQEARLKLPVLAEEQGIVEAINDNPVVLITGETGSGKTTQVPQFLYEAGYAKNKMIGITEPRRVAAMSMSCRVREEMNLTAKEVSYLIRFEGNVTPDTKVKFMTDGVLLKEIQSDFLLSKYSVIILDEAHERSVYTDILIGLLSRIVPLRTKRKDPLKLIIMSATLRVEDFVENPKLFKIKPPVINVESRQFPVTIHFNRRTSQDYVNEALRKAVKIHTQLPEGGILIFLTGQREVNSVVRRLRKAFPYRNRKWINGNKSDKIKEEKQEKTEEEEEAVEKDTEKDSDEEMEAKEALRYLKQKRKKEPILLPKVNLDNYSVVPTDDTHEDLIDAGDDDEDDENLNDEDEDDEDILKLSSLTTSQPLWVLPLYSLLPSKKQARVFEPPPEGCRLCVVSTNVAETSLTIPNVKYVVDSGRCKSRLYDKVTGVTTFRVCYTSKAAANQRAGRAGRTGPGHCYKLYSSAVFNDQFEQFGVPEIQRKPVDDLLLQMKVMNIDKVVNFPFPSSPDILQLKSAERRLCILGALEQPVPSKEDAYCAKVTSLGHSIAAFPVAPRYGKMLALSQQHDLLRYTVCLVAALSVQEVLVEAVSTEGSTKTKWLQTRRRWAGMGNSLLLGDLMVLIRAVGAAEFAGSRGKLLNFCEEHGLRHKAITEVRKLRQQLTNEIILNLPDLQLIVDPEMPPPTEIEAKLLRQIVLAGMGDQVAHKLSPDEVEDGEDKTKYKHAYKTLEMEDPVFMHSSSVLRKTSPEWVVYQEVYETNKIYMRGVTAIEPEWLPKFAASLCKLSEPLTDPPPRYDNEMGKVMCRMTGTFGKAGWELPAMELEYPASLDGIRWFARFLLEGAVCPKLRRFVLSLLSTPSSVNKSWAKLLPRTETITKVLASKGVMSKDKLYEVWEEDSKFLLSAYQKWLPESAHSEVALLWPPL
ncbi:probable ATP-dependent RNA helicase kurz [Cephus cinctus]|uniref:RNA helicase n=1 Tax=Cephus cinctus TaxID=211228 RepID=A0AAJ7RLP6_CEPCN|nr:probable ATP-dependent RNA helicase kurz [Cephus cinctus]XP_024943198.1 probable ATP-dependent RNA helicase kurz [Cephus cinctus]